MVHCGNMKRVSHAGPWLQANTCSVCGHASNSSLLALCLAIYNPYLQLHAHMQSTTCLALAINGTHQLVSFSLVRVSEPV